MPLGLEPQDEEALKFNQRNFLNIVGTGVEPRNPMSVFSDSYTMGPDESGWAPKGPIIDHNMMTASMLPPQPIQQRMDDGPGPESQPLIAAIESGYADKKIIKPIELIREGVETGNTDLIDKGHRKLVDLLHGERTFGERFADAYFRNNEFANTAHKMAADVVMNEMLRPGIEEATRFGLIEPDELLPGQMQESQVERTIPQGSFQFDPSGAVNMTPVMTKESQVGPTPGARLTPLQEDVVTSRQKALQAGAAYKAALAGSRIDLNREKVKESQYKREVEGPAKTKRMEHLNQLADAQANLAQARVDWYKNLPGLRRELATGVSPFELEALKRVHAAVNNRQPIAKGDWVIFERWLRKGSPIFGTDFLGRIYNRLTGEQGQKGQPFGWIGGLPEPPDFTVDEQAHIAEADDDAMHQLGMMLKSLLQGVTGGEEKPASGGADLPTPKTPEEAAKLKPGTRYRRPDGTVMVR